MLAVVVGAVDYGEADRIVRLLSVEEGRISVMARRARSSRRRFGGALDPGTLVQARVQRGRGALAVLGDVEVVQAPRRPRDDLDRLAYLAYGCEVCAALAPEHDPAPRLFRLLVTWLDLLEQDAAPGVASRVAMEAKALTFAGLGPRLDACARCEEPLEDPVVFDPEAGGGLHARCGGGAETDAATLALAERLRRTPLAETPGLPAPAHPWLLSDFVRHQLGRDLRSRALVDEIERPIG